MTKQELKQYRSICAEIQDLSIQIEERSQHDFVKGSDTEFPYVLHTVSVGGLLPIDKDLRLLERMNKLQTKKEAIEIFVESIEDSLTRRIFEYRYIRSGCKSWTKVAIALGGDNTQDSVRKIHDRYLKKH